MATSKPRTMTGHLGQDMVAAAASKCSEVGETPPASKRGNSAHVSERVNSARRRPPPPLPMTTSSISSVCQPLCTSSGTKQEKQLWQQQQQTHSNTSSLFFPYLKASCTLWSPLLTLLDEESNLPPDSSESREAKTSTDVARRVAALSSMGVSDGASGDNTQTSLDSRLPSVRSTVGTHREGRFHH